MYAVIQSGGKQYRVEPGQSVRVESLPGEVGSEVVFDKVLAVATESELAAGAATTTAHVKGTILSQGRGDKIRVFKFKRKKQYKRTIGHRQNYTEVQIQEIVG